MTLVAPPLRTERARLAAVRRRIAPWIRTTPLLRFRLRDRWVVAKLELLQVTGAFKVRGALAALSAQAGRTVVACSGGNHGLGVAYAAKVLGRRAIIYLPTDASQTKVEAMRALGAELRQPSDRMDEAFNLARAFAEVEGLPLIHPYDDPEVVRGQGTVGLELLEQAPEVRRWLVAVGGGGLAAGMALALEGMAEVVPVEPEGCPTLAIAQAAGEPRPVHCSGAARTSLGAPELGRVPWAVLRRRVRPCLLVSEAEIAEAQRWLWREARLVAEPGGATALAALLSGSYAPPDDEPVGLILCGGNADGLPG